MFKLTFEQRRISVLESMTTYAVLNYKLPCTIQTKLSSKILQPPPYYKMPKPQRKKIKSLMGKWIIPLQRNKTNIRITFLLGFQTIRANPFKPVNRIIFFCFT